MQIHMHELFSWHHKIPFNLNTHILVIILFINFMIFSNLTNKTMRGGAQHIAHKRLRTTNLILILIEMLIFHI